MNLDAKKATVILVVFSFTLTSINMFVVQGGSLTKQEAIGISRNSKLVRSLLEGADYYTLEVHYLNKTQINKDHGVWCITWYIHPMDAASAFRYVVSHSIDEETGEILDEGWASMRGAK